MSCTAAVGFATLPEPLRGPWPFVRTDAAGHAALDFPPTFEMGGRTFVRGDSWSAPLPGVVKQYRENVDRNSMHLYVHADHTWEIDHVDEANPERGLVLEHAYKDVIQTWWGAALLAVGVVGMSAGVSFALSRAAGRGRARLP